MTEVLVWAGVALTIVGIIWGKIVIAAARDFVKTEHPDGFRAMSGYGTPFLKNYSTDDRRVDRALAAKMLTGALPLGVKADARMAPITRSWRMAFGLIVAGAVLIVVAIRAAGG